MPAEECVGLEDEERLFPVLDAAGEEDEPETIGLRKRGFFDLAVQDDELLTEQRIFSDELGFATRQVGSRAENQRMAGRLGEMKKGEFKEREQTAEELSEQVVRLPKDCQRLSADCSPRSNGVKFQTDGVFSQHRMTLFSIWLPTHAIWPF